MGQQLDLEHYFSASARAMLDACTACARCVEVCPVTAEAGVGAEQAGDAIGGVLTLLREGTRVSGAAQAWLARCNGCGDCIPACPEQVNPRRLLMFAQSLEARLGDGVPDVFRKLARAVRLMAAMQLPPEQMARLFRHRAERPSEVVFYTGCNALRTPHVLLNAMQVLDALQVDYQVAGGPANCCGIAHTRTEGRMAAGGEVMANSLQRFAAMGASQVLSWCPSCQLQMGETWQGFRPARFELDHISSFLAARLPALAARMDTPVARRVVLHAHAGLEDFGRNVERLLGAVPGLEVLATVVESGYTCGFAGSGRAPQLQAADRQRLRDTVSGAGADAVVSLYHSCHRSLLAEADTLGIEVLNFTDLLVRGLGGEPVPDLYARLRGRNSDEVLAETRRYLQANGVDLDDQWFATNLDDLFAMAEYQGGLQCFGGRA